jgi:hypothetical protein
VFATVSAGRHAPREIERVGDVDQHLAGEVARRSGAQRVERCRAGRAVERRLSERGRVGEGAVVGVAAIPPPPRPPPARCRRGGFPSSPGGRDAPAWWRSSRRPCPCPVRRSSSVAPCCSAPQLWCRVCFDGRHRLFAARGLCRSYSATAALNEASTRVAVIDPSQMRSAAGWASSPEGDPTCRAGSARRPRPASRSPRAARRQLVGLTRAGGAPHRGNRTRLRV